MTYDQFLSVLRSTRHFKWGFLASQAPAIRASQGPLTFCPITAVCFQAAYKYHRTGDPLSAAQQLDLAPELALAIMNAADNWTGHDGRIRRDLITAVTPEDSAQ